MDETVKSNAAPGTTDQLPRWEGPQATRPSSYLPAKDDPDEAPDANGETNAAPERAKVSDAGKVKGD
ncbi:hypothetical protein ACLE20_06645 [Rhizobium sp. YIM 134829]|uniref:hypothetical protein n=1 Tax=Rhizobium sp. YIM 134829 TaxID=3390453 RepID=UPI00397E31CA